METRLTPTRGSNRVALYIRVSTHEQENEGFGLEAQEQNLREYLKSNTTLGLQEAPIKVYQDTHTGSDLNRPKLQKMLDDVRAGKVGIVVVWKIDRLSRTMKHLLHIVDIIEKHQVSFVSVQENMDFRGPIGRLVFHLFSSIAEFERGLIKSRTTHGKITSAKMGNYTGGYAPYGYRKIKNPRASKGNILEIVAAQAKWVRKIFGWYVKNALCPEDIGKKLNKLEIPFDREGRSTKSEQWNETVVQNILKNPVYRGSFVAHRTDENGQELPSDAWVIVKTPTIVSEIVWHQAQQCRKSRRKFHGKDIYLLSGKIIDGSVPGFRTFSGVNRTKGGSSYRRKQFTDSRGNHHPVFELPAKALEDYVWNSLKTAMDDPDAFYRAYRQNLATIDPDHDSTTTAELQELRRRVAEIEELELPRIHEAYEKGVYSDDVAEARLQDRESELGRLKEQIEDCKKDLSEEGRLHQEYLSLVSIAKEHRNRLDRLTREEMRAVCDLFVDEIVLTRARKPSGHGWDVHGKIKYRFNLGVGDEGHNRGRTQKALRYCKNRQFLHQNHRRGGADDSRYTKSWEPACGHRAFVDTFRFVKWNEGRIWKTKMISVEFESPRIWKSIFEVIRFL